MGPFKGCFKVDVRKQVIASINKEIRTNVISQLSAYISSKIIKKILRFNFIQFALIKVGLDSKILFLFIFVFI